MNFGELHARWYDRWHAAKDYESEVDQLGALFGGGVRSVLDIGCGTGRHLELLAKAGYRVTGVDRSPDMAAIAEARLAAYPSAEVIAADAADADLAGSFDAVIMMFSVFGYHTTDSALFETLAVAHRRLRPGGMLVFDVLDGAAVLRSGVRGGCTVLTDGGEQLIRLSGGWIDRHAQVYSTDVRLWMFSGSSVVTAGEQEVHPIRYFAPREVDLILDMAGFVPLGSAPLAGGQAGPTREWARVFWARKGEHPWTPREPTPSS
ncbi:class I SAM-dependent methyltransferase [Actinosynnema sp. ALI-1.44]|uniref:class I SAM-dependent methyltransferase n=1 Tax=Actinosynnema sp. ALI-1.44 TaxID=1933779 RepID=UPI00143DBD2D|nr:class I SAM-dependent methyltransferase [Actinosynnema sp. ALI-1.44]